MFFLPFRKKNVLLQTIYDIPRAGMPISINKHYYYFAFKKKVR